MTAAPSPAGPLRRSRAAEALSPRATQALIRRNLCAWAQQQKQAPATCLSALDEVLPPLTSRNDVDVEIYALLAIVVRDFVRTWYGGITPDEDFYGEVVHLVAHCTRALEQRLRKLDVEALLLHDLAEIVDQHVQAYRAAHGSVGHQPRVDGRGAYHALVPLPFLVPVPPDGQDEEASGQDEDKTNLDEAARDKEASDQDEAAHDKEASDQDKEPSDQDKDQLRNNEAMHSQLLVQAALAVLLPTEDLENPCLTALVSHLLSDLVIGALVVEKATQPWLLLEAICSLSAALRSKQPPPPWQDDASTRRPSRILALVHALVHAALCLVALARWLLAFTALAPSLPPRRSSSSTAVLDFAAWRCAANLLELRGRKPWLTGLLDLCRCAAVHGPGRLAGLHGSLDRLLSHHIHTLLSPSLIAPSLRSLRGLVFPNNAPLGPSSLRAPENLDALRRRAAAALAALVPNALGRIYFGPCWSPSSPLPDAVLDHVEHLLAVLDDQYCNKHLVYSIIHLFLVKLLPELEEKGVVDLWAERLG
ncbi:hypothetical protein CDD81_2428 [Ophiocordyceps australis]|uniref:PXA domain-containing protein n=1 Tax=Ophiocordyceps australis TaxID=1399860 RepID=A0A2C5X7K8_9HYPO|nr:hypothetical protein CDD81_2428 [Ophiocordyceps australis]